ncbi:MAG: tRNA (adenosine(37)-N6)-threonylcarbamoyltransferase complex ATPase subunit type 1 TsaE [Bacteroidetes bacterium]|nr:tRNA (adenosine(37)-N6)-threonylcarbamoyltransferase complex ATPase subunit type 1 TsaE [Bacteroidota bacterium]
MIITYSLDEIQQTAQKILDQNPQKVILFFGEMGAGKTTFIKSFVKKLGVENTTSSPTFSLVNEYQDGNGNPLYHFDVYRLKTEAEAYDMGIDEYLYSGHWCLIEWPEKIPTLIPNEHSVIKIKTLSDGRRELEFR